MLQNSGRMCSAFLRLERVKHRSSKFDSSNCARVSSRSFVSILIRSRSAKPKDIHIRESIMRLASLGCRWWPRSQDVFEQQSRPGTDSRSFLPNERHKSRLRDSDTGDKSVTECIKKKGTGRKQRRRRARDAMAMYQNSILAVSSNTDANVNSGNNPDPG